MADQLALLTEAHNRGILPPDKEALYQEAVRRGLIPGAGPAAGGSRDASGTWMPTDKGPHLGSYIATDTGKPVVVDPSQDPYAVAARQGTAAQNLGAGYGAETLNLGRSLQRMFLPDQAQALPITPGAPAEQIADYAPRMIPAASEFDTGKPQTTLTSLITGPRLTEDQRAQQALFANSDAAKVGRVGADVVNTAPTAMIGGAAVAPLAAGVKGAGILPYLLRAGISGAGQGAGAAFAMPADDMTERLQNMSEGAAFGGGLNALGGGAVRGYGALKKSLTTEITPEIQSLMDTAGANQVPLTFGEATNNPFVKKLEVGLEKVPFSGMGGFREGQAQALSDAGGKLLQGFDNTAGADPQDLIQQSAQTLLKQNKAKAGQMFNAVRDLASKASQNPDDYTPLVNMNGTKAAAQDILQKFGGNQRLEDLNPWLKQIRSYVDEPPSSFEEARRLRSALGTQARKAAKGAVSGATSDQESSAWTQLQNALEGDIQDFANNSGGKLKQAYNDANQFYRENVVPFKDPKLRNLVTGRMDTDTLLSTFIKNERPQLAQKLYGNLTPEGQQTLKYAVLQKAMDAATDQGGRNGVVFSPAKFANVMEKMGETKSVLFKPEELDQVDGFAKLARAASRAGQYAENPPTGNRLADFAGVGSAVLAPTKAIPAFISANVMRRMLTQPWGKSILLRAAKTENPTALRQLAVYAAGRLRQGMVPPAIRYMNQPEQQTAASP